MLGKKRNKRKEGEGCVIKGAPPKKSKATYA